MLLYALTIVAGAFLLFQIQPMLARSILPWFGGAAAVWTTCLLFFQVVLLFGYLYAHALVRYFKPRTQMLVHIAWLSVSALALPVYPSAKWKPGGHEDPVLGILVVLTATVGLPYFLLSTTGPLLQAWYARRFQDPMPYRLCALSNAGSMFALVSYPALFEPVFTAQQQARIWSVAYGAFIVLCGFTAVRSGGARGKELLVDPEPAEKPRLRLYAMWLALPACASALLLATTNHLTQNVAAIPFLWVLPLSIYLLTFILCFQGQGRYGRNPYLQLLAVGLWSMGVALGAGMQGSVPIKVTVPLFAMGLYVCCMACHGELARLKPHPRFLTQFYLSIAAGGAVGGILVGLIAPKVFRAYYELPVGLVACGVLVIVALLQDRGLPWFRKWKQPAPLVAAALTLALAIYLGARVREAEKGARIIMRNFYGLLKVTDSGPEESLTATRTLTHGTIRHGEEFLHPSRRNWPTARYGPNTGIGIAIREKQKAGPMRVGAIGLGAGTIAAYGRAGDVYRFYEINPLVLDIARSQFFFLRDSAAELDAALGDARLTLEREEPQNYDVLAVDAFSGDSIPVHLLTREAISLYFRHLKPDGVLAVHITNRYLDLRPVLAGESRAAGKSARLVDTPDGENKVSAAKWVLVTSAPGAFDAQSTPLEVERTVRMWTDDYSNLFQILK